ncbi:MAG: cupin domain-containing protein, partial [Dehalococcoidia bacterium]|nr:cupin domain-containing protein [Dehalococcoidia bacterium]
AEREVLKAREPEARTRSDYEDMYALYAERRDQANTGKVVIKGSERPWHQGRQGLLKYFLSHSTKDVAVTNWTFFIHDIRSHSGRHRHQGGLAIYVIEGRGWTTVDGVRYDWEEGDLLLLPIKPGGVEHQHFNAEQDKPCKWLAMIYTHFGESTGSQMEQKEASPAWQEHA